MCCRRGTTIVCTIVCTAVAAAPGVPGPSTPHHITSYDYTCARAARGIHYPCCVSPCTGICPDCMRAPAAAPAVLCHNMLCPCCGWPRTQQQPCHACSLLRFSFFFFHVMFEVDVLVAMWRWRCMHPNCLPAAWLHRMWGCGNGHAPSSTAQKGTSTY